MTRIIGRVLIHDREIHVESDGPLAVGDTLDVIRGNGPREGDRMGVATVTAFENGLPVLVVDFDGQPGP
jgi:hypothetical protein